MSERGEGGGRQQETDITATSKREKPKVGMKKKNK